MKVLDFGLAKALNPLGGAFGADAMSSPGVAATVPGMVLGTVAYMAPEQACGMALDERADIWAFGVVFYEMLSGHRPFEGKTTSDTIAAVLRQDIQWTQLPRETPDEIRRLLRRCLKRDPKERLHNAADARHHRRRGKRSAGRLDRATPLGRARRVAACRSDGGDNPHRRARGAKLVVAFASQ